MWLPGWRRGCATGNRNRPSAASTTLAGSRASVRPSGWRRSTVGPSSSSRTTATWPSAGEPIVPPACQSQAPKAAEDALVLHLIARNLVRRGNDFVPVEAKLGENRSGSWGAYPVEDWIVVERYEGEKLLPSGAVETGT